MNKNLRSIYFFGIIFLIADQAIKFYLNSQMVEYQSSILIKNFLNLTLVHNTGAAFSILTGGRIVFILIGIVALVLVSFYAPKGKLKDFNIFTYSLLIGGIMGNLLDRIIYGYVTDYISLSIFGYNTPIFNFADICIVLAVIFILCGNIKDDLWKE